MQWLSVLWTFFYIGPAKELDQYPASMTSVFHLAVYQQNTEYIYIDRRFVYTVILSAILIQKKKKKETQVWKIFLGKITKLQVKLGIYTYIHMT